LDKFDDARSNRTLSPTVLAAALSACATETVLLNSERIEQQFGSYGIDVLASAAGLRRSSLYSIVGDERTCRTYTVVRFADKPDTSYSPEHAKVLAGNSLGEVFKANAWSIHKQTQHIGSFHVDTSRTEISTLMQLSGEQELALHVYQLLLAKNERVFEYATLLEAHHPDYLSAADLLEFYPYDDSGSLSNKSLTECIALVTANEG